MAVRLVQVSLEIWLALQEENIFSPITLSSDRPFSGNWGDNSIETSKFVYLSCRKEYFKNPWLLNEFQEGKYNH